MTDGYNEVENETVFDKVLIDDHALGNVATPSASELMVINTENLGSVNLLKELQSQHALVNLENSFIITTIKDSPQNFARKFLTLENGANNILKLHDPPPIKKQRVDGEAKVKEMLFSLQHTLIQRLENIEKKVENVTLKCQSLGEKVESMLLKATTLGLGYGLSRKGRSRQIVLGVPSENAGDIKLNSHLNSLKCEDAYPDGSWLGNPDNPNWRVRCDIHPKDLASINQSCTTPEKMALTLLDYLFDRETQACSNISGSGKHGKLQLDPLRIFGIRCHLMHMFGISEQQWHRIKLNIDSKCRTAFRRKQRGMSLTVKGFRERPTRELQNVMFKTDDSSQNSASSLLAELSSQQSPTFPSATVVVEPESSNSPKDSLNQCEHVKLEIPNVIHTEHGDIHVIRATLEQ